MYRAADLVFTFIFSLEMFVKIVAMGLGPRVMPWASVPPVGPYRDIGSLFLRHLIAAVTGKDVDVITMSKWLYRA